MTILRGILGLLVLFAIAWLFSDGKRRIRIRVVGAALAVDVVIALLVLRWQPGRDALKWLSRQIEKLIGFTKEGTTFVFGPLTNSGGKNATIFALEVLPVIIFLGAIIGFLYYVRVIQYVTWAVGGAIRWLIRTSRVESFYASVVIFLGQSEAPLMISPLLPKITRQQLFTVMAAGFAAAAGSTLVGYSLLGAPLPYLLAASVMNAPAALMMAKTMSPDREEDDEQELDVRAVRDEESANVIDALGRGALAGGKIAVTVGALLIAFVALIAMLNAMLHAIGNWFGYDGLTFQRLLGWVFSPFAWLIGVPWSEANQAATYIGEKTVLNEFVAFKDFGPHIDSLSPITVVIVTFALAGFANFASIAIQIGTLGSLCPPRRGDTKLPDFVIAGGAGAGTRTHAYDGIAAGSTCSITETSDGASHTVLVEVDEATHTATVPSGEVVPVGITDTVTDAPGTLVVAKRVTGPAAGKQGQIGILVVCAFPLNVYGLLIPAGTGRGTVTRAFGEIPADSTCLVLEVFNGHDDDVAVHTDHVAQLTDIAPAATSRLRIIDTYSLTSSLAATGTPVGDLLGTGLIAVLLGAGLVLAGRRRRVS